jgi:hypothetical protein
VTTQASRALYIPPTRSGALLRTAPVWERMGRRWFTTFSGVVMIEAEKQIYAASMPRPRKKRRAAVVLPFPRPATGRVHLAPRQRGHGREDPGTEPPGTPQGA